MVFVTAEAVTHKHGRNTTAFEAGPSSRWALARDDNENQRQKHTARSGCATGRLAVNSVGSRLRLAGRSCICDGVGRRAFGCFGDGVVGGNLEELRVGFGAFDIAHGDGGFAAGLDVLGNGEDEGRKVFGTPTFGDAIVGEGGYSAAGIRRQHFYALAAGFNSFDGLHAEIFHVHIPPMDRHHANGTERARRRGREPWSRRVSTRMKDLGGGGGRIDLGSGFGDGIANGDQVLFYFGAGVGAGVAQEFASDPFGADAALGVARDVSGMAVEERRGKVGRSDGGGNNFSVERISGDDSDVAGADGFRAALGFGGRREDEQERQKAAGQEQAAGS
jgi:hypothetical protein